MTRKIILYIATSLDGYIATENDSLEWLFKAEGEGDNGYSEFYDLVDTIIMGRRTYDWIIDNENEIPYKNKKCYVFSRNIKREDNNVEFVNEKPVEFIKKIKETKGKNIWIVGGGKLIHHFMQEKLINEFIINLAPVIICNGIPLFRKSNVEMALNLKSVRQFNQFVELHYILN